VNLAIQRKARDSNPHFPKENRVSSAARPTVSGYLPFPFQSSRRESNPRFLFVREASLAVGPRDDFACSFLSNSTGGSRTLLCRGLAATRARESNRGIRAYETRLSTRLARMSQAPVSNRASRLYESRVEPCRAWEVSAIRNSPGGNRTRFSALRGRCPEPVDDGAICRLDWVVKELNLSPTASPG
jgi:hypothetical protein